jgi:signal transduction histidine kinase
MERRVFVLAPSGKDAQLICGALANAHIEVVACASAPEVVEQARQGIGALVLAEEALKDAASLWHLYGLVETQPTWSDLPVVLLTQRGRLSQLAAAAIHKLGNVTTLERPTQVSTLVSTVRTALRTRERQYDMRQADVRKDMFLATLAHELRNPLAPLSNGLHLLQTPEVEPEQQRWAIDVMQRQTTHLSRLVDDLLDVARITRGKIVLQKEPADLRELVNDAIETSRPVIDAMGHRFEAALPGEPVWVDADRTRIAQCVSNLLTNAAKYTPRGGRIELALKAGAQEAEISVRDNGIGFAPLEAPRLFEVFAQVEHAVPRAQGGLGLGLSIVKALVEMHGGTVRAHSDGDGEGAEFTLRLPRQPGADAQPPAAAPANSVSTRGCCRVLVVDDNRDSADSMAELLNACGHETRTAYSGGAAMALLRDWKPQLALLDIGLPDMSGHELARRIREAQQPDPPVLVALTGWGQQADVARSAEAGFEHHLTKPADIATLLAVVDRAIAR